MNGSEALWQTLQRHRLIALLSPDSPEQCVTAYEILQPLGVALEIALRGEHGLAGIQAVLNAYPDARLLAGTVLTRDQAKQVLALGVCGVVSADYVPGVVEVCVDAEVMCIPGGLSDCGKQLVQKADMYGFTLDQLRELRPWQWVYKVFPAMADEKAVFATVKSWRAVYPGVQIVYTGGVTLENVARLSRQDPNGILCGSSVIGQLSDPNRMRDEVQRWLDAMAGAQSGSDRPRSISRQVDEDAESTAGKGAVVTFGEIMLRLSPPAGQRFRKTTSFDATYGGAEANVAASLAQWDVMSRYVSILPDNDLGQAAVDSLRSLDVDTSHVLRHGDRIGIYYLEHGASQRSSRVIYDRANSAITSLEEGIIDWESVFAGAAWFHWTGITPALSEGTAAVTAEAVRVAKRLGLTVSVDLNYRSILWSRDRARQIMTDLMEYVDVVVANEADAADVFGISTGETDLERGKLDLAAYEGVARQLVDRFDLQLAAITLRESHSASENTWSACLWNGEEFLHSQSYRIQLVDRVGGGDAFSAGLIYGLLTGKSTRETLEFGVAASCLKQTVMGDFNIASAAEVEALAGGNVAGRIKR